MDQQNDAIKIIKDTWRRTNPQQPKKKREVKLTPEQKARYKAIEDAKNRINRPEEEWY